MFMYRDWDAMLQTQKKTHQYIFKIDMTECSREKVQKFFTHLKSKKTLKVVQPFCLGLLDKVFYFQLPTADFRKIFSKVCVEMLTKLHYTYELNENTQTIKILK